MRGALPTSASVSRVALIACAVIGLAALAAPSHAKAQSATKGAAKASTAQPTTAATPPSVKPSRLASKGCKWEAASGAGLRAWVERCDYRDRKIDLFFKGHQLMQRYSDGDAPEALVDVLDMLPNETQSAAMTRVFASHTDAKTRAKCVLAPYKDGGKPPAGAQFYTFAPNAAYAKTLAKNKSTDIPDPRAVNGARCPTVFSTSKCGRPAPCAKFSWCALVRTRRCSMNARSSLFSNNQQRTIPTLLV